MFAGIVQAVRAWADGAGGLGVLVVALLDSSVLALPNASDALIMYLAIREPGRWWYYAAMGVAGVVAGSWPLYLLARRGGQAFVERRLARTRASRLMDWYARSAFAGLAVPAFLPPPFPLKIFVLAAGAAGYPWWRVAAALTLGRGARHVLEAGLAAVYRDQAVVAVDRYGATLGLAGAGAVAAVFVAVLVWQRRTASP
ncbi:MAG: YqaA family protein [Vicinamibacterales bacterium]